jgi:hypothetical protein
LTSDSPLLKSFALDCQRPPSYTMGSFKAKFDPDAINGALTAPCLTAFCLPIVVEQER